MSIWWRGCSLGMRVMFCKSGSSSRLQTSLLIEELSFSASKDSFCVWESSWQSLCHWGFCSSKFYLIATRIDPSNKICRGFRLTELPVEQRWWMQLLVFDSKVFSSVLRNDDEFAMIVCIWVNSFLLHLARTHWDRKVRTNFLCKQDVIYDGASHSFPAQDGQKPLLARKLHNLPLTAVAQPKKCGPECRTLNKSNSSITLVAVDLPPALRQQPSDSR